MSNTTSTPMDGGRLTEYARQLARALAPQGKTAVRRMAGALGRDMAQIRTAHRRLTQWGEGRSSLPPAVEWLLDNHYLALREGAQARRALRRGRAVRGTRGGGVLIAGCARGLLRAVPGLEREEIQRYLAAFQSVRPLTERELSLLVSVLALELVAGLARQCEDLEVLKEGGADPAELERIFGGLRALSNLNWGPVLEEASQVEEVLRRDPSGHYPDMGEETRRRYRQQVCRLARKYGLGEPEAAGRALELARQGSGPRRHIGWYLYREPLGHPEHVPSGRGYAWAVTGLSLAAALAMWGLSGRPWATLLLLLPLSDIVKNTLDFFLVRLVPPRPVPRMELREGIPPEGRTLCVVVSLLTGEESGPRLASLLERYRLANRDAGPELRLGILADLPDSESPMGREGRRRAERARQAVEALNEKYGGGFYLFFRRPAFNRRDERYMGWERKRGALVELVRLLKGRRTGLRVEAGNREALRGTKFIITLDADTNLNVGTARELAGAMLHPLNQPVVDRQRRVVTAGHALFQPRVSVELEAANRSLFSRVFAGLGGVDPYGSTASDVYHDLFDQGSYTGKGIFQVDAFFTCLDRRFPDNAILSHDLLEGSYLRAGLLGEVELTDGCPYQAGSYFARLHRWIRGDWQLLPWLGRRVPDGRGGREDNPLTPLAKWKILDNLRRSLSPVLTLTALVLGICFSGAVFAWAGGTAVLAAASNLLLSGAELAARRRQSERRYHSTVIAGFGGAVLQTAFQLLLLPYQAYISAWAIGTALWRMLVSRKNLLAWVTAAQTEGDRGSLASYYRKEWFSPAVGLVTLAGAQLRIGMAVGLCWVLAPAIAWAVSRPDGRRKGLPAADRAFLLHQATLIWRYFGDFLRREDHFLPPDNWQEQPGVGLARRTSPTNIGLALLSAMAAADLDLLPRRRAAELIGNILGTVEGLEKWRGHLYNWYDTASLRPLHPRYVSTVDSGNLRCCLVALEQGLREWGEEELARRAAALSGAMSCAPLYDRERRLFSIGYEAERDRLTPGWYDLMASEARQTSYLAVARGEVPPRHWRALGRMLLGDNGYSGMASWTGTMFEYFMPALLLPCEPNSFMYESLAFCIYAQKRRGARTRTPWGISESGFYAFDPGMSYQYKAHGVQALGLKRGLDSELVIAPYSSFLALALAPRSALRNLRRLRDMGLEGRYGLYEAVDYTPSRLTGAAEYEVVRSYMSHHLGMSLVAIDNALRDNIMQRRFMADSDMAAFRELLQERVPVGAPVMRQWEREVPEKPKAVPGPDLARGGAEHSRLSPQCHLVSNGSYSVLACDNGLTWARMGEVQLTLARPGAFCAPAGVSVFFQRGGELLGLTPAPLYQREGEHRWEFYAGGAAWVFQREELTARLTLSVPRRENGELRRVELTWRGQERLEGELLFYLEPVLCPLRDFQAHPAFSRLFLEGTLTGEGAVFRRRPRGEEKILSLAALWDGEGATACLDRAQALGRGGLRALAGRRPGPLEAGRGTDPCLMICVPAALEPGERRVFHLALAAGDSPDVALEGARRVLEGRGGEEGSLAPLVRRLGLEQRQALEAFRLLSELAAVRQPGPRPPQSQLWAFGVSGDLPIAAGRVSGEEESRQAELWCAWHQLLTRSGYPFDLVLMVDEGGDYRRPLHSAVAEKLKQLGAEGALGAKGGIHLVPAGAEELMAAWAGARLPLSPPDQAAGEEQAPPLHAVRLTGGEAAWEIGQDGSVTIRTGEGLPPVGWSQILCSARFGWLTDETGGGLLWAGGNAREGRLTPWQNDPLAVGGPERITLELDGAEYSVFADGDGCPCTVTYRPGGACWKKQLDGAALTTWAHVPQEGERRCLTFSLSAGAGIVRYRLGEGAALSHPLTAGVPLTLVTQPGERGPVSRFAVENREEERRQTLDWWRRRVSALEFYTPDPALNRYLGGWCLYQVTACRLMARTSQYQNGGAFGFRDQLQDVCALLFTWPERAREQLLLCASRQFEEGDVQHWWHPPGGAGVRTRISDDLLWLPWVLCRYCNATGDWGILEETAPYLTSAPLRPEEMERYEVPQASEKHDTIYCHALAAAECVLKRGFGAHGLLLMGGGDWNDGMNRVGAAGRGESVWLTWFCAAVLQELAPLCRRMGEEERARELLRQAERCLAGARAAWDGDWFLRGYYDDGAPLGGAASERCQLDSIAQSFAALPRGADRELAQRAVTAALERLFDREHRVVRLFDPAFDGAGEKDPGYIKSYPPGVRENGGQYTHAALWLALACFRLSRPEEGWEVLRALLPEGHPTAEYRAEPYVIAADVSWAPGLEGRAGWSWYTGAAGWYWQVAVEELLGLKLREGRLLIEPNLPRDWEGFRVRWSLERAVLDIRAERGGEYALWLDGKPAAEGVRLDQLEGEHTLRVSI